MRTVLAGDNCHCHCFPEYYLKEKKIAPECDATKVDVAKDVDLRQSQSSRSQTDYYMRRLPLMMRVAGGVGWRLFRECVLNWMMAKGRG